MPEQKKYCNACGRELRADNGMLKEDALFVEKNWGYFSRRDLEVHEFILCEDCYDKMISGFARPVRISPKLEVMDEP